MNIYKVKHTKTQDHLNNVKRHSRLVEQPIGGIKRERLFEDDDDDLSGRPKKTNPNTGLTPIVRDMNLEK